MSEVSLMTKRGRGRVGGGGWGGSVPTKEQ